jgi:hypothetical protein
MKNLVSYNQLDEWRHFENTVNDLEMELDLINDYYECLIECEDDQASCKRICRRILSD